MYRSLNRNWKRPEGTSQMRDMNGMLDEFSMRIGLGMKVKKKITLMIYVF